MMADLVADETGYGKRYMKLNNIADSRPMNQDVGAEGKHEGMLREGKYNKTSWAEQSHTRDLL